MKSKTLWVVFAMILVVAGVFIAGCNTDTPVSTSGVTKATVQIQTQPNGMTVEQQNVADRLVQDNKPGSIKHLYLLSPFNNRVIYYSTVSGKVTSGGKRLTPTTLDINAATMPIYIGGYLYRTGEVIQDDGTYGTSAEYLFFWDTKGIYHQLYPGQAIVMITSEPIVFNTGTTIAIDTTAQ